MIHKTWQKLNRLSLRFDDCMEQKSFVDLFSKPSVCLKNLNELKLIYSQSSKIKNKQIRSLASEIGNKLENLTSLKLEFSECPLLTSDSLAILSDKICKKLKKLRLLSFSFLRVNYYFDNPSFERGIRDLTSIITPKLESLESFTLDFQECMDPNLNTEKMLDELCPLISLNWKELKKLTLMFALYENIELKREIRERLNHIPMLYIH